MRSLFVILSFCKDASIHLNMRNDKHYHCMIGRSLYSSLKQNHFWFAFSQRKKLESRSLFFIEFMVLYLRNDLIQYRIAQDIINIKPNQNVTTSSFEDIQTNGVAEQ